MTIRGGKAKADQLLGRVEEVVGQSYAYPAAEIHGEALRLRGVAQHDADFEADRRRQEGSGAVRPVPQPELLPAVTEQLVADPAVPADAIAVSLDEGVVTPRGTVYGPAQKWAATRAAARAPGRGLRAERARPGPSRRDRAPGDADLRADVLQALMLDPLVPTSVDAHVRNGVVTLTGMADYRYQRDAAETSVPGVSGVVEVRNETELTDTTHVAAGVQRSIRKALVRQAKLDADRLIVLAQEGTVTLSGTICCERDHAAALSAARAAPGVHAVDDRVTVCPPSHDRP